MNVIFLDIDGVLNSTNWMVDCHNNGTSFNFPENQMDPSAISRLNRITDVTKAKLVISSTWRLSFYKSSNALELLQRCMKGYGITGEVIDFTPYAWDLDFPPKYGEQRGSEIQAWLEVNLVDKFVILDDSCDMGKLLPNLVRTNLEMGLTDLEVERIIEILK